MLHQPATIRTVCPVTGESIQLEVGLDGPAPESDLVVHFALPAARWWEDIGYT